MMETVTAKKEQIQQAILSLPQDERASLLKWFLKVAAGTDVIIAKEGKPVARLSPVESDKLRIRFGVLKGKVKVANDFDAPLPEDVLSEFEGRV